jgi:hypothetical protein
MAKPEAQAQEQAQEQAPATETEESKRTKKLSKTYTGSVVTITESSTDKTLVFDISTLSSEIQENLKMHGAIQKLGDAASGKSGQDAVDAIQTVWDGLVAGNWTVRAPATPKVTKSDIKNNLENLSADDKAAAQALLEKLGIKL